MAEGIDPNKHIAKQEHMNMTEPKPRPLAEIVAEYEPADDVTDLDTARRLVTALRTRLADSAAEYYEYPANVFSVYLTDKQMQQAQTLYDARWLLGDPKDNAEYWLDPPELDEAFTDFVAGWIDVAWDMYQTRESSGPPVLSA